MPEGLYPNVTLNDVQLAKVYFPILLELAQHKHTLTYGELVDKAKELHPDLDYVQNSIPVSTGKKLDVIGAFQRENHLPDLASLIISKKTGDCGTRYPSENPSEERERVYQHDWSNHSLDFDQFTVEVITQVTPRTKRKREEATIVMSDYNKLHKSVLPPNISDQREFIIELLIEGFEPDYVFEEAIRNLKLGIG